MLSASRRAKSSRNGVRQTMAGTQAALHLHSERRVTASQDTYAGAQQA